MDDKSKKKTDAKFVSCDEKFELDYIKKKLKKQYPMLKGADIDEALKQCCAEISVPRPREDYMECMEKRLNIHAIEREAKGIKIVKNRMYWSAGVGILPFPIVDLVALLGIQVTMVGSLAKIYNLPFKKNVVRSFILSLLGELNSVVFTKITALGLMKFIPGVGNYLSIAAFPVFSGGVTYAIGKIFIQHFEMGGTLLDFKPAEVREHFRQLFEEGKKKAEELKKEK